MNFFVYWPQPLVPVGGTAGQASNAAVSASNASVALEASKVYRVIATTNCYIRLAVSSTDAATSADILLPAGVPMVLKTDKWSFLNVIQVSAGGVLSAVKVQLPL